MLLNGNGKHRGSDNLKANIPGTEYVKVKIKVK